MPTVRVIPTHSCFGFAGPKKLAGQSGQGPYLYKDKAGSGAPAQTSKFGSTFSGIYRTNLAAAGGMPTSPELIRMEVAITQTDFNARLKQVRPAFSAVLGIRIQLGSVFRIPI